MPRIILAGLFVLSLILGPAQAQFGDDTPEGDEAAPALKGAKPIIPLDVKDPTYDFWKEIRDDLSKNLKKAVIR